MRGWQNLPLDLTQAVSLRSHRHEESGVVKIAQTALGLGRQPFTPLLRRA